MRSSFASLALLTGLAVSGIFQISVQGAVTLDQANQLWNFNHPTAGPASAGQIVTAGGLAATGASSNLTWTGSGLSFNPSLNGPAVPGVGSGGTHAENDSVNAATFTVSNAAAMRGSSTIITRLMWDGPVAGTDDNFGNVWLVNNSMTGANNGSMFGFTQGGSLAYYTAGVSGSGATHTYNTGSSIVIQKGVWYDIAIVVDDLGTANDATGQVRFYAAPVGGSMLTNSSGTNAYVTTIANGNVTIGSEAGGTGSVNQRKTFDGTMDYLAFFNSALTQQDIAAIFAVPEPSRAILAAIGGVFLLMRRKRIAA